MIDSTHVATQLDPVTATQILTGVVQNLTAFLSSATTFVKEQAPDVARQIIEWRTISCIVTSTVCTIILTAAQIVLWTGVRNGLKTQTSTYSGVNWQARYIAMTIIGTATSIVSFIWLSATISELIQLTYAPKVYLIEYLAHMVR